MPDASLSLSLLNAKRPPIFTDVYIGSRRSLRFLVDTGAQTSLIDPKLAAKLELQPEFRVETVTEQSALLVPCLTVTALNSGGELCRQTELVFQPVDEARRLDRNVQRYPRSQRAADLNSTLSPSQRSLEADAEWVSGNSCRFTSIDGGWRQCG